MSKPETVKKEIEYEKTPLLADLDFQDLVKKYRDIHVKEKAAEAEMKSFAEKKKPIGEELQEAIKAVEADVVNMRVGKKNFRTTLVKGNPDATKTDEDKLREAMGKIGKLDAGTIAKILKAAQVPSPRTGYVLVTVQDVE